MTNLLEDVRSALRQLRRYPLYTEIIILILTLGIGANTAIFSIVDALLFRRMPVDRPYGLFYVRHQSPLGGFDGMTIALDDRAP